MKISDLKNPVIVSKDDAIKRATPAAKGIVQHERLSRGESFHQVYQRCLKGSICEIAIATKINGTLNNKKFDYTARGSYATDIISPNGYRIEVKLQQHNWLTLRPESKNTLITNIKQGFVDYVITCDFKDNHELYYIVTPKLLIMAKAFTDFITPSKYDNNYFFNHYKAAVAGECFQLAAA